MKTMDCKEGKCVGKVGVLWPVSVMVDFHGSRVLAYPCKKCKRLYLEDGTPLCDTEGNRAFFRKNTCVVFGDKNKVVGMYEAYSIKTIKQPGSTFVCR